MTQFCKSTTVAAAGLAALTMLASPGYAASDQSATNAGQPVQIAHMSQGQATQLAGQPCPMGAMGSNVGGQGMMGPGTGGQGMMGQGMMGSGMGGQGMTGPGFGMGSGPGDQVVLSEHLTTDDVRHFLEHRLQMHGNKRLKVGEVKEANDDKIIADITTVDGSLVQRLEVDPHTGKMQQAE